MVRLGALLRRSRNKAEEPELQAPVLPSIDTPPLVVMIPDVAGVSSFRLSTFPDAQAGRRFILSLSRPQRERAHAFWALQAEAADPLDTEDNSGEAMVLIRSSEGSDLVYVVSFVDIDSAQSFARFEVKRGMHLSLILIYWASMVNLVLSDDGVQLIPEFPPVVTKGHRKETHAGARPVPTQKQAGSDVRRLQAEAEEEKKRLEAELDEMEHLHAEAEELKRLQSEAAQEKRLQAEAERQKQSAKDAEEQRLAAESDGKGVEDEAETREKLAAVAEEKRKVQEVQETEARQAALEELRRSDFAHEIPAAEVQDVEAREAEAAKERQLVEEELERRLEDEAERQTRLATEERLLETEAAEDKPWLSEDEGGHGLPGIESDEQARLEAEAEQRRLEGDAYEQRLAAEAAEQARLEAEAEERRLAAEAAEQARLEAEAEERRLAAEAAEQARLEAEAEERRLAAEVAEQARLEAEAEERRLAAEAAEQARLEAQAQEWRRQEEEEERRLKAEAEAEAEEQRLSAEAEQRARLEALAEERRRLEEESEEQRRFEAAKRAILAHEEENAGTGVDEKEPSGEEAVAGSFAESSLETLNPIEELLRGEADSRVQVPRAFAKEPQDGALDSDSLDGLEPEINPADIADEVGKILRRRRWAKRESPFEGFKSPPGRF